MNENHLISERLLTLLLTMLFSIAGLSQRIDSLRIVLSSASSDSVTIAVQNELGKEYLKTNMDSAVYFIREALSSDQISNYPKLNFAALNLLGNYYQRIGEFDSARMEYLKLQPIAEGLNDLKAWSTYYNNLGIIYTNTTQYDSALDYYQKALDYEVRLADTVGISEAYNNIGVIHFYAGNVEKCLEYITKSIAVLEKSGGSYAVLLKGYNNLGAINQHYQKNYDSAFKYYDKARMLSESLNELRDWTIALNNLSSLFQATNELDKALSYAEKSYEVRVMQDNKEGMVSSLINMALIEQLKSNFQKAKTYLDDALQLSQELGSHQLILQSFLHISENYEQMGDFENALLNARNQLSWKDSVFNESKDKAVSELETKYETEKKEQQIELQELQLSQQTVQIERNRYFTIALIVSFISVVALWLLNRNRLKKKQQILLQQEKIHIKEAEISASISSQEKERARYARDLHDGFGQMISILNMNLGSLRKNANPDERQTVFNESEKVINEMYDELKGICFDLMPQTLINNGLQSGLEEFAERINKAGEVFVETNFFGLDNRLTELQEISIYRISQEWINNVLKYSDASKITLQVTRDENELTLLIEDDGQGFDKQLLSKAKGNGWKNLNSRANLIKGQLELETQKGIKGNTLIVNAPSSIATVSTELEVLN